MQYASSFIHDPWRQQTKLNANVMVGIAVAVTFTGFVSLLGLSIYLENNRTVELPPACEIVEPPPKAEYGRIFLRIPNAARCGTDASIATLKKYVDFDNSMAIINDFKIAIDIERAGYLITFDSPNGYWRQAKQK